MRYETSIVHLKLLPAKAAIVFHSVSCLLYPVYYYTVFPTHPFYAKQTQFYPFFT